MANTNSPFGFRAVRHASGGCASHSNAYRIAAGYATDLNKGDVVSMSGGNIVAATAGGAILGTFLGCEYTAPDGSVMFSHYWPASTATQSGTPIVAIVQDDPNLLLQAQTNDTINLANEGAFVDLVLAAGDGKGHSRQVVGAPGGAASQFQITRVVHEPVQGLKPGEPGQYAVVELKAVKHIRSGAAAGIAV